MTAEHERLGDEQFRRWGPYLSERAWGTVREDYSADGDAWESLPARPRPLARLPLERGRPRRASATTPAALCLAFAFWNGRDPILKERIFGLTGPEGNHGEDAKEYWWYLDSTPTHSWMRWRYLYPQARVPLRRSSSPRTARRGRARPRVRAARHRRLRRRPLLGDHRRLRQGRARRHRACGSRCATPGPRRRRSHVLPTLWFRNTWSWGVDDRDARRCAADDGGADRAEHHELGRDGARPATATPTLLFCDNETNARAAVGRRRAPPYPEGRHQRPRRRTARRRSTPTAPAPRRRCGTGSTVAAGATADDPAAARPRRRRDLDAGFDASLADARAEADEFYADAHAGRRRPPTRRWSCARRFAGMLWSKQFFHYDVDALARRRPRPARRRRRARRSGRNARVARTSTTPTSSRCPTRGSTPGTRRGTSPSTASPLAHVDPTFAKEQLILLCREWYMHPNGQLPAYEWAFGDVNPPVHAWAALRVFEIDGAHATTTSSSGCFHKLLLNFTWWVNRKDAERQQRLRGRLPRPRQHRPVRPLGAAAGRRRARAVRRHRVDGDVLPRPARDRARRSPSTTRAYEDVATKFFEHFACIADAHATTGACGTRRTASTTTCSQLGRRRDAAARCARWSGCCRCAATTTLGRTTLDALPDFAERARRGSSSTGPSYADVVARMHERDGGERPAAVDRRRPSGCGGCSRAMLDEDEFLSPHGLRALSRAPPRRTRSRSTLGGVDAHASTTSRASRRPACSAATRTGAARSGSRSTSWSIEALRRFAPLLRRRLHASSARPAPADELHARARSPTSSSSRLVAIFLDDADGRRPVLRRRRAVPDRPGVARPASRSTSTSTATPAPASAPRTRPAGPAWSPT